jgi:hypothetical protein
MIGEFFTSILKTNNLNNIHSAKKLSSFILNTSKFQNCETLTTLCKISLLIPATTVSVESGFSIINNIKTKKEINCQMF